MRTTLILALVLLSARALADEKQDQVRAAQLQAQSIKLIIEGNKLHQSSVKHLEQSAADQAAADKAFAEAKRLQHERLALLRNGNQAQASVLWEKAEGADRAALLAETKGRDRLAHAAREEATAREEEQAAQKLQNASAAETNAEQKARLLDEAKDIREQAADDHAEAAQLKAEGDKFMADAAALREKAKGWRALALKLYPPINKEYAGNQK